MTVPADLAADDLLEAMQGDKKVRARAVRFALPRAIGAMARGGDGAWTVEVEPDAILQVLAESR
ncbi:MAG: hypothetical protein FIA95_13255 [Gemmatimonadetes bacterium]|nr:hypothetical protein [Gemmatimonadota bacterium]